MTGISQRYTELRERISAAVRDAGRSVEPTLIGVVKGQSAAKQLEAYEAGLRDFAHSYMDEALDQWELRARMPEARWHFIGPVQSNKTRYLQSGWHRIHSLSRLKIARRLPGQHLLVQVRIGGEMTKSGVDPDGLEALLHAFANSTDVRVCGLMTMPPPPADFPPDEAFGQLAVLAHRLVGLGLLPAEPELSMGMSGDFEAAIGHGAGWLRLGTALFGDRNK